MPWQARADAVSAVPADEVRVPTNFLNDASFRGKPYVRLVHDNQRAIFKVVPSGVPDSEQLIVAPDTFALQDQAAINVNVQV